MKLDRALLEQMASVRLTSAGLAAGPRQGDRRSPHRGRGLEFADYRPYAPGDDLRLVDWNVYGRLQAVLVRLFHEDRNMSVQICLDASASMGFGDPRKADYAADLAASLAVVGLIGRDSVTLACSGGTGPGIVRPGHDIRSLGSMTALLERVEPDGVADLHATLSRLTGARRSDRVFLISDLWLEEDELDSVLRRLAASSRSPILVHVQCPQDLQPDLEDGWECEDIETGERVRVPWGDDAQRVYRRLVDSWLQRIVGHCRQLGIGYVPAQTSLPVQQLLTGALRELGVVHSASGRGE